MSMNNLTLADIAEVERSCGQPLADLADPKALKGKLMQSLVWVIKRKTDPAFTLEAAGRMTMDEMNEVLGEDPTSAA